MAISASLLYFLMTQFALDFDQIMEVKNTEAVLLSLVFLLPQPFLVGGRWFFILNAMKLRIRFKVLIAITYIAVFFNNFLIAGVGGDAMKIWYAKQQGHSGLGLLGSVFIDRLTALCGLFVVILLAFSIYGKVVNDENLYRLLNALSLGGLLVIGGLFAVVLRFGKFLKQQSRLFYFLTRPLQDMTLLIDRIHYIPTIMWLSICVHVMSAVGFYFISVAYALPLSLPQCLVLVPPIMLLQLIPISVGGWGVREAAAVTLLALAGVEAGQALMVSIAFGLLLFLASLPGSVVWIFYNKKDPGPGKAP